MQPAVPIATLTTLFYMLCALGTSCNCARVHYMDLDLCGTMRILDYYIFTCKLILRYGPEWLGRLISIDSLR